MNAYVKMLNLYNSATRDPKHASVAAINRFLTGKALAATDASLRSMARAGYAYKGTPADPRIKVQSVLGPTAVFLTSCPSASTSDPFIEYDTKTGKALPVPRRSPPPPYLLTIPMKKIAGQWKVTDILQNVGKTCHG